MASHLCCLHPPPTSRSSSPTSSQANNNEPHPFARTPDSKARGRLRRASLPVLARSRDVAPLFVRPDVHCGEGEEGGSEVGQRGDFEGKREKESAVKGLGVTEVQRIFVGVNLPPDHPHALGLGLLGGEDCRAGAGLGGVGLGGAGIEGIPRSPSFVGKVRRRFSRRSLKTFGGAGKGEDGLGLVGSRTVTSLLGGVEDRGEGGYDGDARVLGSEEVLEGVREQVGLEEGEGDVRMDAGEVARRRDARTSLLKSLEWLRPALLQKQSFSRFPAEDANVAEIAGLVALRRQLAEDEAGQEKDLPSLPQTVSSPNLLNNPPSRRRTSLQRSSSAYNWDELTKSTRATVPVVERTRLDFLPKHAWPAHLRGSSAELYSTLDGAVDPNLLEAVARGDDLPVAVGGNLDTTAHKPATAQQDSFRPAAHDSITPADPALERQSSDLHLPDMHISQQLRSLSAMSETLSENSLEASYQPWNRVPTHGRNLSAASALMPSICERVRGDDRDGESSVYSRAASEAGDSGGVKGGEGVGSEDVDAINPMVDMPYEVPADQGVEEFPLWPLREKDSPRSRAGSEAPVKQVMHHNASAVEGQSETTQFLNVHHSSSPKGSKRSTSTFGKQSKFLERFTPPKKLVRKRRSIFRFLRPGSRKQQKGQPRSISTPTLWGLATNPASAYDGPFDDPSILTVQYELPETPSKPGKAASENNLTADATPTGRLSVSGQQTGQTPSLSNSTAPSIIDTVHTATSAVDRGYLIAHEPSAMERRKSLAEYECSLSMVGDQRRKPSTPNLHNLNEMNKEQERQQSLGRGFARRLSRAKPLADNAAPLMEQALQKHVEEKSLFRSASKAREVAEAADRVTPVFQTSSFAGSASSRRPSGSDLLNPMERGESAVPDRRSYSVGQLGVPESPRSSRTLPALRLEVPQGFSGKRNTLVTSMPSRVPGPKRIGTSLASWSRYPSHSREQRCGSARDDDQVNTRDFAVDIDPQNVAGADDEASDHEHHLNAAKPARLPKSRSMTFGAAFRHYTSMITGPEFFGRHRRTSIAIGGKLEYPELEMVQPTLPHHHHHHPSSEGLRKIEQKLEGIEEHVKEAVKEDTEKLRSHLGSDHGSQAPSPFRQGSPFATEGESSQHAPPIRKNTILLGPDDDAPGAPNGPDLDDFDEEPPASLLHARHQDRKTSTPLTATTERGISFDGTVETQQTTPRRPSRADLLADIYKAECLHTPVKQSNINNKNSTHLTPTPVLKPLKPRSPEQQSAMSTDLKGSTIRRYPSVTVVDDRKGHWRSVSFLSVGSSQRSESVGGGVRSGVGGLFEGGGRREDGEGRKLVGWGGGVVV